MDIVPPPAFAALTATPAATSKAAAKSAHDFESVFVGQMTKLMMETVQTEGSFTGGHGEEMFRGVLAEQLGGAITAHGGLGLAPVVMKQIIAMQGGAAQSTPVQNGVAQGGQADAR